MRRMTRSEAIEMIETTFDVGPDCITQGLVEVFVPSFPPPHLDLFSYLSVIAATIDPDSITIYGDEIEGSDMDCFRIVIKTQEAT